MSFFRCIAIQLAVFLRLSHRLSFHPLRWSYIIDIGSSANACDHQTNLQFFLIQTICCLSILACFCRAIFLISPNILAPYCRQQPTFVAPKQTYTARSHFGSLVGTVLSGPWRQLLISHTYLPTCHFNAVVYVVSGFLERAVKGRRCRMETFFFCALI